MPLHAGDRIRGYEIVAPLGAGGMGAVWKARDARLGRMVAIKVLKDDEGDIPRLVQEARTAAQLNHPNIVTIHEIGEQAGLVYIVMEFIDGRPLHEHVAPKGLPLRQALKFGIPIARALEAAHKSGVIHRDLKPPNVMVTAAGDIKLLDFGLAKVNPAPRGSADPTATVVEYPSTGKGQILGTIEYMSPEQAQGKKIDARSDIFSFGTLFYELLTGRRPFRGNDSISVLAAILRDEPEPPSRASGIRLPPAAEQAVLRCLRKDPERRFQTAADLRAALEDLSDAAAARKFPWRWPVAAGAALAVAAVGLWWSERRPAVRAPQSARQITFDAGISTQAAFSPDGKLLAFASDRSDPGTLNIWLRQTAGGGLMRLTTEPGMEYNPQFSPDGTRLFYLAGDRAIYERSALGGPGRKVVENAGPFVVSSKGEIAFISTMITARPEMMRIVSSQGGTPAEFHPECRLSTRPAWSPEGDKLFFIGSCGEQLRGGVIVPRGGGAPHVAINLKPPTAPQSGMYAAWFRIVSEGLIYTDWSHLYRFGLSGSPVDLVSAAMAYASPAVSNSGELIFTQFESRTTAWSIGLDARGATAETAASSVADGIGHFSVSRDGRMLVFGRLVGRTAGELVIRDQSTGSEKIIAEHQQLGVSFGSLWPQVAPDGQRVIYRVVGAQGGHYLLNTATTETHRVARMDEFQLGSDWSPDGKHVIGECPGPRAGICELDPQSETVRTLVIHGKDQLLYPSWSWDGKAIVFMRRRSPADTSIVIAAATGDALAPEESWVEISEPRTENSRPRFNADGSMVYYVRGRNGQRVLVGQKIERSTYKPADHPVQLIRTPIEITAVTGANGPYPLITVTTKRLFYSVMRDSGNLWMMKLE